MMMNADKSGALGAQPGSAIQATGQGKQALQGAQATEDGGAAFRALLERLEKTAQDLDAASASIDDPRQLGEAVESARASVEEAVLMGGDLLEAYRASQARASSESKTTSTETSTDRPLTGHGEAR